MSYKLSYTAQEVDELLGKVKGGVCLPVVELSTASGDSENHATLTADESTQVRNALMTGLPTIIKCVIEGQNYSVIANAAGGISFMFTVGSTFAIHPNEDGGFDFGIGG